MISGINSLIDNSFTRRDVKNHKTIQCRVEYNASFIGNRRGPIRFSPAAAEQ